MVNFDEIADQKRIHDLKRLLNKDSIIIDVGAHVGEFSSSIRKITSGPIYAFEPIPDAFKVLKENINDGNFFAINKAVGINNGPSTFHVMKSFVGSSLLPPVPNQESNWLQEVSQISVSTTRLDTFIEELSIPFVSLLKTDSEGMDLSVLQSAGILLNPTFVKALLIEISFHQFHKGQEPYWKILELMEQKGYFLAGFYPHFNRYEWLWWADVLFLPNTKEYSTNL